jgi:hypothetical protein
VIVVRRAPRHAAAPDAVRHRPADQPAHGILPRRLPGSARTSSTPEVPIIAVASGRHGYYRQGVGWRMLLNGLQFRLFGSGPILSAGVEAGAFVNPTDRDGEPTIQAFCVPIVYVDRDTLDLVENTYGLTYHHRRREAEVARLRAAQLGRPG